MRTASLRVCRLSAVLFLTLAIPSAAEGPAAVGLVVRSEAGVTTLSLDGADPFHSTDSPVIGDRLIEVAQTSLRVALWTEVAPDGRSEPFYAISLDGRSMAVVFIEHKTDSKMIDGKRVSSRSVKASWMMSRRASRGRSLTVSMQP